MGEMNEQAHRLLLEQRKTLSLGGVQDVKSFDENEVLLLTVCGVLTIRGKELHVGRLELEKGEADIEGSIDSLVYTCLLYTSTWRPSMRRVLQKLCCRSLMN